MTKFKSIALNIIFLVVIVILIIANVMANFWSGALTLALGSIGGYNPEGTQYFTSEFEKDEDLVKAQEEFSKSVIEEGATLLKNENQALPLAEDEKNISIFSINQREWIRNGSGSSGIPLNPDYADKTIFSSFKDAGLNVNEKLKAYYDSLPYTERRYRNSVIAEQPWANVKAACENTWNASKDVAVVIFGRTGGEGNDLIRDMSSAGGLATEHYLELNKDEKDLLRGIKEEGFKKTIVILNTGNALELNFLDEEEFGVDACLWVGGTGQIGVDAIGELFTGVRTPSGHTVDTQLKDNFATPATKSFGLNPYIQNGQAIDEKYSYVNYSENIYLGYRYFESRYEALMLGDENVGDYDYDEVVSRPFGFGMSYTTFEYSNMQMKVEKDVELDRDSITVSVDVTNTGAREGKDAVQVYIQAPYTDYDREHHVEKSSICLADFVKTPVIPAGETVTVEVSFDAVDMMKSYDSSQGAYIMDSGTYYVTVGEDAHAAMNNIIEVKGVEVGGDPNLVKEYEVSEFTTYKNDLATNEPISNKFDDADIDGFTYLSRENWSRADGDELVFGDTIVKNPDGVVLSATKEITPEIKAAIDATGWESSGIPKEAENNADVVWGKEGDLELIQLRGKAYDDPMWDDLLDQVKLSEAHEFIATAGYSTAPINSIKMPSTLEADGPNGLRNMLTGWSAFEFPGGTNLASTWNKELHERFGELVGEDGLRSASVGWYAPAFDMHRTAFSGRNNEYYSEDPILSGFTAASVTKGALSKGMLVYIKHLALNDQEANRDDVCTWANEQTIREIYLRPFEIAVKEGKANAMMTAMNRIGTVKAIGHYNLTTGILRNEWQFKGLMVSDITYDATLTDGMLSSGADTMLTPGICSLTTTAENKYQNLMREVVHRAAFNIVNSAAMNGIDYGSDIGSDGVPVYQLLLIILDVAVIGAIVAGEVFIVKAYKKQKMQEAIHHE